MRDKIDRSISFRRYSFIALAGASLLLDAIWFPRQHLSADTPPKLPHAFDAGWMGEDTCELIFEDESMRVARCAFPPGIGHEKHFHNPHFGYVLEGGTLRIKDSSGENVVSPRTGGTWSTTTRTVHEAVNIGDATTSYLIIEPAGD